MRTRAQAVLLEAEVSLIFRIFLFQFFPKIIPGKFPKSTNLTCLVVCREYAGVRSRLFKENRKSYMMILVREMRTCLLLMNLYVLVSIDAIIKMSKSNTNVNKSKKHRSSASNLRFLIASHHELIALMQKKKERFNAAAKKYGEGSVTLTHGLTI
ncbi:hypothetical protein YC2023_002657 [Brassica napus]